LLLAFAAFLLSVLLTAVLRSYALSRGVLDVPNLRSSHQAPTPRGGGVAVVVAFLLGVAIAGALGRLPGPRQSRCCRLAQSLPRSASSTTMRRCQRDGGWRRTSSPQQLLAALGGMVELTIFDIAVSGWAAQAFGALLIVWLLNLYNFMDGIDGIAGVEAVTVCAGGAAVVLWSAIRPARSPACCRRPARASSSGITRRRRSSWAMRAAVSSVLSSVC
jgi:Fuc2NAc and GlcNAc transferase